MNMDTVNYNNHCHYQTARIYLKTFINKIDRCVFAVYYQEKVQIVGCQIPEKSSVSKIKSGVFTL